MSENREQLNQSQPKGEYRKLNEEEASQSHRYPSLFRVKIVALILIVLTLILLIIDLFSLVYLLKAQPLSQDLTFVNGIVMESQLIQASNQVQNLIRNMLKANPQTMYQRADLLLRGTQTPKAQPLRNIFWHESDNLLYLMKVQVDQTTASIGFYIHSSFPIPKDDKFKTNLTYYTFELEDDRKSLMFSLDDESYIQYNSIFEDPLECLIYGFRYSGFLSLMNILYMDVVTTNQSEILLPANDCFNSIANQTQYEAALSKMFKADVNLDTQLFIDSYEIYRLYS